MQDRNALNRALPALRNRAGARGGSKIGLSIRRGWTDFAAIVIEDEKAKT